MNGSRLLCAVERCDKATDLAADEWLSRGHYHEIRSELAAYLNYGDYPIDPALLRRAVDHMSLHVTRHAGGTNER